MRIQHNIPAINSSRSLSGNQGMMAKNLEKLSSGYRINRAGDDAAGLAISEKMRASIKGLETAKKNANDGISLVQTAEGALTEVHSMLNRMTELATQSANGTYDTEVDRANLQKEVESLKSEINRISDATNYNGIKLLNGDLSSSQVTLNSVANGEKEVFIDAGSTGITGGATRVEATKYKYTSGDITASTAVDGTLALKFNVSGKEHTITMTAPAIGGATAGNVAAAINGTAGNELAFADDAATREALAAFKDNFTITNNVDKLVIEAKTAGTANTATVSSITVTGAAAAVAAGTTVVSGTDAGYTLDATAVTAGTLKLGDQSFELQAAATRDQVMAKLIDAGVNASASGANSIFVLENDAIKTAQAGTGISSTNSTLVATSDRASAGVFAVASTAASGGNLAQKLTINYLDAAGNQQTKELDYTASSASATANNAAIANAISADADLKELFSVASTATAITLTSNIKGANGAQLLGMTSKDATVGVLGQMTVTKGEDKGTVLSFGNDATGTKGYFKAGDSIKIDGTTYEFTDGSSATGKGNTAVYVGANQELTFKNLQTALEKDGIESKITGTGAAATMEIADTAASNERGNGGLTLQIGESAEASNKVNVSIESMSSKNLKIDDIDISTQDGANSAIDKIKNAINSVSSTRGALGAVQNRLEHTINNLGVTHENITAAESRIRDVDVAEEMMSFTKNNILSQAAQAMLAQANQLPQGVLQLLG